MNDSSSYFWIMMNRFASLSSSSREALAVATATARVSVTTNNTSSFCILLKNTTYYSSSSWSSSSRCCHYSNHTNNGISIFVLELLDQFRIKFWTMKSSSLLLASSSAAFLSTVWMTWIILFLLVLIGWAMTTTDAFKCKNHNQYISLPYRSNHRDRSSSLTTTLSANEEEDVLATSFVSSDTNESRFNAGNQHRHDRHSKRRRRSAGTNHDQDGSNSITTGSVLLRWWTWWEELVWNKKERTLLSPSRMCGGEDNHDYYYQINRSGSSNTSIKSLDDQMDSYDDDDDDDPVTVFSPSSSTSRRYRCGHEPALVTHFCFLAHGHRGYSRDLSYLQHAMEQTAHKLYPLDEEQEGKGQVENEIVNVDQNTGSDSSPFHPQRQRPRQQQELIVHASICNERKTTDGVINGGERLADEILHVIRTEMGKRITRMNGRRRKRDRNHRNQLQQRHIDEQKVTKLVDETNPYYYDVTISLLGNSLGGIYTRYAISKLSERCTYYRDENYYLLDGQYRIHFNVFCTTASPHLGIAGHTFFPIPRTAEIGVAHAMGTTGHDLFRLNDLMKNMATCNEFLNPLRSFRKRIAYANAYNTDFPVPLHTAAFLSSASDYPHHFVDDHRDTNDRVVVDDNGLVIAALHTPQEYHAVDDIDITTNGTSSTSVSANGTDSTTATSDSYVDDKGSDDLVLMSRSLDALGWKKVFVDVRKEIPKIPLPQSFLTRRSSSPAAAAAVAAATSSSDNNISSKLSGSSCSESDSESDDNNPETMNPTAIKNNDYEEPIHRLRQQKVIGSKDLAEALSLSSLFDNDQFHWPMGHNMIVAFSRSRLSAYMNKAGRPVVDAIATELIESIYGWSPTTNNKQ